METHELTNPGNYAADIDLDRLRELLKFARANGFESLSAWAEIAMQWAEVANGELMRLRPKPGQAYIDGNAVVTARGRRYCLKHPGYELNEFGTCIQCQRIEAWMRS